jgi:Zn finger protein HypA/HybF involved in hydrogenase expression
LPYIAKAVNETVDDIVNTHVTEFSDTARKKGTITQEMYEKLIRNLDDTGEIYDVDIEVSHPVSGQELAKIELGDEIPESQLDNVLYLEKKEISEESNQGEIQSFAIHTHTDDCYAGHRHLQSGCTLGYMCHNAPINMNSLSGEYVRSFLFYCTVCSKLVFTFEHNFDYSYDEYKYTRLIYDTATSRARMVEIVYFVPKPWRGLPSTGDIRAYNIYSQFNSAGGRPTYDAFYAANPLLKTVDTYSCGLAQDEISICNQIVTSITATNPIQTIAIGNPIITTATATYLDGHTGTVVCSSNFDSNKIGLQTVTLTYSGLVGSAKTTGTRTCTVNVTVKELYKLTGITVSPASQEETRYTNPYFTVIASYDNNTTKQVMGYTLSNYNSSLLGTQMVTLTYKESDVTKTSTASVIVKNLTKICPVCGTTYYLDEYDSDQGCPNCTSTVTGISVSPQNVIVHQGEPLDITVEATYLNRNRAIVTGWTSDYDPSQIGIWDVTITYQTFTATIQVEVRNQLKTCSICTLEYELNTDGTDPGCPVCSNTVASIEATPGELTINKHQSLPITVTATYKDGHTEVVNDWASNLMADTAGIYEVMILYKNVIDLINVTVLEDGQIQCPICGLKYIFNDSPKGCPSCYVTLTGIEAALRSEGIKVPYKSKMNLQIAKIYRDEHRELTYTGWTVSNYYPEQLGSQTVTVHYESFIDELDIEVVDDLPEVTCPNGHTYYLNEDGSDPGCPYCSGTEGKAEALFYFDTTYTNTIIEQIYTHGEYHLEKGDYLKITIKPRNVSILSKLLNMFSGFAKKEYTFGGEVT